MIGWDSERVAAAAGASLGRGGEGGPRRAVVDSREAGPGDLFVGLAGTRARGGSFAAAALAAGAWGVLVDGDHAEQDPGPGAVLVAADPLEALGSLARAWRRELGARVVAITGSTGKTSTKDILAALLGQHLVTAASPGNRNTEIGLPLSILEAPAGTEALVLELAMRGPGQIALLTEICEPEVGVIVNVGPAHLELLGSVEAVAAAKAELMAGMAAGATAVIPAGEPRLEPHVRADQEVVRFGPGGDVRLVGIGPAGVEIEAGGERLNIEPGFRAQHLLVNLLAAVGAARALGVTPGGRLEVAFSEARGERIELPGGVTVVDDCYNANPMSMRAALEELRQTAPGRRVAVLGDMLELGIDEPRFHRELGAQAAAAGVELLVTVGPRAALAAEEFTALHRHVGDAGEAARVVPGLLRHGDTVLIKASRGVGLEVVADALASG
ncbi:MAG: UDP-N-acetylmuramoyl-tripeptide--D-alanyl-D-alanine ligase [Solirubrobacteraceae bacterium]|nr:UDP-N-acetylmuramoyl-tripeptide--D-alanyl-D-alanine ligase [Solirubrobacteraceae bacterium]